MQRARLGFWQIWNMCLGFLGIQIGFGLQNANTSRLFQTLGADVNSLAILWIAAPITGLLVQPLVGYFSDRTWGILGRRRPYILVGAIITSLALFAMPHAKTLWIAAALLWILDASINVTMEPFRAFVGDNLPPDQHTHGFAMQSFFIGIGAVFASSLPWLLNHLFQIKNTAPTGEIPPSVQMAFFIGAICLSVSVLWTVFHTQEYPPAQMTAAQDSLEITQAPPLLSSSLLGTQRRLGLGLLILGLMASLVIFCLRLEKELYVLSLAAMGFGLAFLWRTLRIWPHPVAEILDLMCRMPRTMRQLAPVQFFSWFGLFALWIYATPAITAQHFGTTDPRSSLYNQGADYVGVLFGIYNGVSALYALFLPIMARHLGHRLTHGLNLVLGAFGLMSLLWLKDPQLLWVPMIGIGFAWASILSMPYAILANTLPSQSMGLYMGLFNMFIVIPQMMAATLLGLMLKFGFENHAIFALPIGGIAFLIAAILLISVSAETDKQ